MEYYKKMHLKNKQEEKGNRHFRGKVMFVFTGNPSLGQESCYCNFGSGGLEIHRFLFRLDLMGAKVPVHRLKLKIISLTRRCWPHIGILLQHRQRKRINCLTD